MAKILMYTKTVCPYCDRAKSLLRAKGMTWREINLEHEPEHIPDMIQKSGGRRTVPQIFVDGVPLGGFDDISALDRQGKLDGILGLAPRAE
jgi:glutaredoxin 3